MEEIFNKEIADQVIRFKGETRGIPIKQDGEYISATKGKDRLKKVEEELEKVGYPIKYSEIRAMDFYQAGYRALSLLAIKKVFNFKDEDIKKVCAFQPKTPLVVKLYMKYFYSIPKIIKKVQDMWDVYWTTGKMTFVEFNEKGKYAILRVEDFEMHSIWCRCVEGYFASISSIVLGKKEVSCTETVCPNREEKRGEYHEFLIKWAN